VQFVGDGLNVGYHMWEKAGEGNSTIIYIRTVQFSAGVTLVPSSSSSSLSSSLAKQPFLSHNLP
jgi:hypothetical protein